MGKNYGQIIHIQEQSMKLIETVQVEGKWEKKEITINLMTPPSQGTNKTN